MGQSDIILKEIIAGCDALRSYEKRAVSDTYYEKVFCNTELAAWEKVLTDLLGVPAKPPKIKPTREDLALTKDHGGITANQTLFRKKLDDATVIAMLWPWGDGEHTTLKAALLK